MIQCYPVIPTRGRPDQVIEQVGRLLPQLANGERIIVVIDGDEETAQRLRPRDRLIVLPISKRVGVDGARTVGTAFVPENGIVVELDDHDFVEPMLLEEIRKAFALPSVHITYCNCWLTDPNHAVKTLREKSTGEFRDHGNLGLGMRAYRKWIYDAVGGYPQDYFPANDLALLCRMDQLTHFRSRYWIQKPLVSVILDSSGISSTYKREQEEAVQKLLNKANNGGLELPFTLRPASYSGRVQVLAPEDTELVSAEAPGSLVSVQARPVNVVLVTQVLGFGRGGGEISMLSLLKKAGEQKHYSLTALYFKDAGDQPLSEPWITSRKTTSDTLAEDLRSLRPDLVVTEVRMMPEVVDLGWPVVTLVQFWRNIVEMTEEGFDSINQRPMPTEYLNVAGLAKLRKSTAIIANSELTAEVIELTVGRPADAIVFPPVNAEAVTVTEPPVQERPFITCPSSQEAKGSLIFLGLARRHPEWKFLLLAGDGRHQPDTSVLALAETLPNVTIERSWVSNMRSVYAKTRCLFIGTQTAETFSRVTAEAIANGIPVLASNAGNLARVVTAPRGVVVPKRAGVEEWDEGLIRALSLQPTPDRFLCQDHSQRFIDVLERSRSLSDIGILVPNAPGVTTGAENFHIVHGITCLPWGMAIEQLSQFSAVILPGTWDSNLAEKIPGKLVFWWCSHATQMDTNRHEMKDFLEVVKAVRSHQNLYVGFTYKDDADLWSQVLGGQSIWLPPCLRLERRKYRTEAINDGCKHVWIPGPYVQRKNVFTALAAIVRCKAVPHVSACALAQAPELIDMAKSLGSRVAVHDCPTRDDLYRGISSCQAAVAISTAETFCYAASDCVAVGVPTIHGPGIPVLHGGPFELKVEDVSSILSVAERLESLLSLEDATALTTGQYNVVAGLSERLNREARSSLLRVLSGS